MGKNYRAALTGVFGCPVDENPTIVMQEAAFEAIGISWRYLTLLVKPADLADAFRGMRAMNFAGINLTVPHKIEALKYVDVLSDEVKLIGATNTVVNTDGKLVAYNTDGKGFVEGLNKNGIDLNGKKLTILGAGGASRAICVECALAGAAEITIINRGVEKGEKLAELLNEKTDCRASFIGWEGAIDIPACDILINATSIGLYPDANYPNINYDTIVPGMIVQDVIPNPADTPFLKKAREHNAVTMDGLSMLVYQGAIAFKLWTGEEAPIDAMKKAIERENQ